MVDGRALWSCRWRSVVVAVSWSGQCTRAAVADVLSRNLTLLEHFDISLNAGGS